MIADNRQLNSNDPLTNSQSDDHNFSYTLEIPMKPQKGLPELCIKTLRDAGVAHRSLSIMWDETKPGWQSVHIHTSPCTRAAITAIIQTLAQAGGAFISPRI